MEHGQKESLFRKEYMLWCVVYFEETQTVSRPIETYPETRCPDLGDASETPHDQLDNTISAQWMNWDGRELMVHVVQPYHREELSFRFDWHTFTCEKRDMTPDERLDWERLTSYITD